VILGLHGEALDGGIERRAFWHRPRKHDTVVLEAEIVVQMARAMFLDHELAGFLLGAAGLARRLGRHVEAALAIVFGKFAVAAEIGLFAARFFHQAAPSRSNVAITGA
jgi:hypothetical protein